MVLAEKRDPTDIPRLKTQFPNFELPTPECARYRVATRNSILAKLGELYSGLKAISDSKAIFDPEDSGEARRILYGFEHLAAEFRVKLNNAALDPSDE